MIPAQDEETFRGTLEHTPAPAPWCPMLFDVVSRTWGFFKILRTFQRMDYGTAMEYI